MLVPVWLFCTAAVAVILGYAGIAKLRSPMQVDRAFRDLAVHPRLARPWMRRMLPYAEIALAIALLTAWGWASILTAALAAVLMAAYLLLIARAVMQPEDVVCNCFGGNGDKPVNGWTLVRNLALVVAAALSLEAVLIDASTREAAWPIMAWNWWGIRFG
ncbi:MAG: MauE/DoxX family redox-associated membrane protein [Pseudoclavibacter sp.]